MSASGSSVTQTLPMGDVVILNDQGVTTAATYTLTATQVQRVGGGLITLANVESLTVNA